jgi:hypothetical protein
VSHSYHTYFGFTGSDLNLDCGFHDLVITRFALVSIRARLRNRSYPSIFFIFFIFPSSFSVSASSKKKKVIFHLVIVSNHISILKQWERERERLVEI